MCSIPQFPEIEFRRALKPESLDPETMPLLTSPARGEVVDGVLEIEGTLPAHWFFENAADGALLLNGEVIDAFQVPPISSQNWTEPGPKTIDLDVYLTPPSDLALELRLSQSMPEEGQAPETITVAFTAKAAREDAGEVARRQLAAAMTETWPGLVVGGDAEAYGAFLWEEFVLVTDTGEVIGRSALLESLSSRWVTPDALAFAVEEVRLLTAATGLVVGTATSSVETQGGAACTSTYTSSNVLRKSGGAWMLASSHISARASSCQSMA